MSRYRFVTLDVFTDRAYGGNPLVVLPEAAGLSGAAMQTIAAELNLSETVFVLPPTLPGNTARLRIFTPTVELPFAGHPTVGAAVALLLEGRVGEGTVGFELAAGPVQVQVRAPSGPTPASATLTAPRMPEVGPAFAPLDQLAAAVGLRSRDMREDALAPASCRGGVRFTILPVSSSAAVSRARLDLTAWHDALAATPCPEIYVVAVDGDRIHARMFAPGVGVQEDPATGAAAVALGGWLAARLALPDGVHRWTIAQGAEIGRPSRLELEVDVVDQRAVAVRVGGHAVPVAEGTLLAPAAGAVHPG